MADPEVVKVIPYLTIGVAIVTGAFTILGVYLASRASNSQLNVKLNHEDKREQTKALRERLEELYQLVEKWAGTFISHHVTYRKVMEGTLTYNQALDLTIERKKDYDAARMFTLAELYFPDCHEKFEEIKSLREVASDIQFDFRELYHNTGEGSEKHAKGITDALELFNTAVDQYKKQLSEYVRKV